MASRPPAVRQYVVSIPRGLTKQLGVSVTSKDDFRCIVDDIMQDSVLSKWNLEHPDKQVLPGDCIAAVNDVPVTILTFAQSCSSQKTIRLQICRPCRAANVQSRLRRQLAAIFNRDTVDRVFSVTLTKEDDVGLVLNVRAAGHPIRIRRRVNGGLIHDWNLQHPDQQVRPGDAILEVNGIRDDPLAMMEIAQSGMSLIMHVCAIGEIEDWYGNMQSEDLTPEDLRLIRELDMIVPTATEVQRSFVAQLPRVKAVRCGVDTCSICLSTLEEECILTQLPCRHCFCTKCIETWLTERQADCPLCRQPVKRPEAHPTISEDTFWI